MYSLLGSCPSRLLFRFFHFADDLRLWEGFLPHTVKKARKVEKTVLRSGISSASAGRGYD